MINLSWRDTSILNKGVSTFFQGRIEKFHLIEFRLFAIVAVVRDRPLSPRMELACKHYRPQYLRFQKYISAFSWIKNRARCIQHVHVCSCIYSLSFLLLFRSQTSSVTWNVLSVYTTKTSILLSSILWSMIDIHRFEFVQMYIALVILLFNLTSAPSIIM